MLVKGAAACSHPMQTMQWPERNRLRLSDPSLGQLTKRRQILRAVSGHLLSRPGGNSGVISADRQAHHSNRPSAPAALTNLWPRPRFPRPAHRCTADGHQRPCASVTSRCAAAIFRGQVLLIYASTATMSWSDSNCPNAGISLTYPSGAVTPATSPFLVIANSTASG